MPATVARSRRRLWSRHVSDWRNCQRCSIGSSAKHHVFLRGSIPAQILFIGEAPGKTENLIGEPFVGRAGYLLNRMLEELESRVGEFSYAITNVVCCLPLRSNGHTREPTKEETQACRDRLIECIRIVDPNAIVFLGRVAEKTYGELCIDTAEEKHTRKRKYLDLKHPAYILRKGGSASVDYKRELLRLVRFLENLQ